jgi:hypothetical protein
MYKRIAIRIIDEIQEWFQEKQTSLLKHIEERNDAQYELTKKTTKGDCKNCKVEGMPRSERR